MSTGAEMMLMSALKTFMPKEVAERIAGWASDGTFDRIGELRTYRADMVAIGQLLKTVAENQEHLFKRLQLIAAEQDAQYTALRELARQQRGSGDLRGDELQGRDAVLVAAEECGSVSPSLAECRANGVGAHTGTSGVINE